MIMWEIEYLPGPICFASYKDSMIKCGMGSDSRVILNKLKSIESKIDKLLEKKYE